MIFTQSRPEAPAVNRGAVRPSGGPAHAGVNEGYAFDVAVDHDVTFRPSLTTRTAPA